MLNKNSKINYKIHLENFLKTWDELNDVTYPIDNFDLEASKIKMGQELFMTYLIVSELQNAQTKPNEGVIIDGLHSQFQELCSAIRNIDNRSVFTKWWERQKWSYAYKQRQADFNKRFRSTLGVTEE